MRPFAHIVASTLLTSAALTILAAAPASAASWTVQCLWNHSPAADRNAFTSEWGQGRKHPSPNVRPAEMKAAATACGVPTSDDRQAQKAYTAYASGIAALTVLQSRHGITRAKVLEAWAQVPAADRNRFATLAPNMTGKNREQIASSRG